MLPQRVGVLALTSALLALPVCGQEETLGPAVVDPQALRAAERALAESRDELAEIAGRDLLEAEAPPLSSAEQVEELAAWREHRELLDRLSDVEPEEWSERDRERVDQLLPFDLTCRAVLAGSDDGRGETSADDREPTGEGAEDPMPDLLAILNGVRVVALGDRLALLRGDEAAVTEGVALRLDLAERLSRQHSLVEPLVGSAIRKITLRDVQRLVERAETSRETLGRLDALLFRAHLELPDPAAIVAQEGLRLTDPDRRLSKIGLPDDQMSAVALAPIAQDFEIMARECRERGCAGVAEALSGKREQATEGGAAAGRIIAGLLMPNVVSMTGKLDRGAELTELARAAVALRLAAIELGAYPASLERVVDSLGLESGMLDGLRYEIRPDGGVSLGLAADAFLENIPESRRALVSQLLAWKLPPPPSETT